jgi:hypothetical protein
VNRPGNFNRRLRRVEESLGVRRAGAPEVRLVFVEDLPEEERKARAEGREVRFVALRADPKRITG